MIKYHGTPITPRAVFNEFMPNRNALISYAHSHDFDRACELCDRVIVDNGAFSFWTKGKIVDWNNYYKWVDERIDLIDYFFIPDVIDGTEEENDSLIAQFLFDNINKDISKAVPVWHVGESLDRLIRLTDSFNYIAFGSSGEFRTLGTYEWHKRMNDVMKIVCDSDGIPLVKIHMLRCLDPRIFTMYPFYSGDSTNLARNHSRDGAKQIIDRIEKYDSPKKYTFRNYYETRSLFECC